MAPRSRSPQRRIRDENEQVAPDLIVLPDPDSPTSAPVFPIHTKTRPSRTAGAKRRKQDDQPTSFLYYGDNLERLGEYVAAESVDLVYLDPPFNSDRVYNIIFQGPDGAGAEAQIQAFDDTWSWNESTEESLRDLRDTAPRTLVTILDALVHALDRNDMTAYLVMMTHRLVELHRVMKPTASLYLHCDPTASHYLKIILDAIFGAQHFRSEISWKRTSAHSDAKQGRQNYGHIRDVILFYTKSDRYTWNVQYTPYDQSYVDNFYRHIEPHTGRRYRLGDLTGPGGASKGNPSYEVMGVTRYWRYSKERMSRLIAEGRVVQTRTGAVPAYKRYLDEMPGVPLQDTWDDIKPIGAQARERLGYPTQKPLALLERIIRASSNPDDVVLDPFCGCGTAVEAAEQLGRRWIGIDITTLALGVIESRMDDRFPDATYAVEGVPKTIEDAEQMANWDRYQFQWWAASRVGALPRDGRKRGPDGGIDGIIPFYDDTSGKAKQCIVSVKSGQNVGSPDVQALVGAVSTNNAAAGLLITMRPPTRQMRVEAAKAGMYHSPLGHDYPKIQIFTVDDLFNERIPDLPDQENQRLRRKQRAVQRAQQQHLPTWD